MKKIWNFTQEECIRYIKVFEPCYGQQLSVKDEVPTHLNFSLKGKGDGPLWWPSGESLNDGNVGREGDWVLYSKPMSNPEVSFVSDEFIKQNYKYERKSFGGLKTFKRKKFKDSDYYDCCRVSEILLGFVIDKAKGTFDVEYDGKRIFVNKDSKPFVFKDKFCGYDDYIAKDYKGNFKVLSK